MTSKLIKERFFLPRIKDTVSTVCETCERCQKAKSPKHANKGPIDYLITPQHPMHTLSMDFLAIDTRTQFKFNVLTKVDEFSKYGFAIQVKSEMRRTQLRPCTDRYIPSSAYQRSYTVIEVKLSSAMF